MVKVVGFIGSLAAGAALVGTAVTGTGAYFTDSKGGSLVAGSGQLRLSVSEPNLNFANLVPGTDKTQDIAYSLESTGRSDVWLTFDKESMGYAALTGALGRAPLSGGGVGRYGHFAVSNDSGGALFESWNLQNLPDGTTGQACVDARNLPGTAVDADGHGRGTPATSEKNADAPPLCGVPTAIKIASNLSSGGSGVLHVTFGITGKWTSQNAPSANVPFKVVATQVNIRPDALNY